MLERIDWSKTWKGRYFNLLGYFFSMYCSWKIFIVSTLCGLLINRRFLHEIVVWCLVVY